MTSSSSRAAGETAGAVAGRRSADGATGDALERGTIVSLEGTIRDVLKSRAEQCDDIDPAGSLAVPEQLAHQPLCTVPGHRPSKASGRDDPQAVLVKAVRPCTERQVAATGPLTLPLHSQELRAPPNPFTARKGPSHQPARLRKRRRTTNTWPTVYVTASRFRPFARRFLRIWRPDRVFIRARKPWVRLRRRLFGWYVRFILP